MADRRQQAVPGAVAVGVVVGLEPVDVDQDERHAAAVAAHAGELAAQHLGEVVVVAQAGQAVGERARPERPPVAAVAVVELARDERDGDRRRLHRQADRRGCGNCGRRGAADAPAGRCRERAQHKQGGADLRGCQPCAGAEGGRAEAEELTGAARTSPHGGNLATAADGVPARCYRDQKLSRRAAPLDSPSSPASETAAATAGSSSGSGVTDSDVTAPCWSLLA